MLGRCIGAGYPQELARIDASPIFLGSTSLSVAGAHLSPA